MKHLFLTVDLGFGDAGKGSTVDFLARHYEAHTVVRYNGGAQAGHRVVDGSTGRDHVFSQFGSGTLAGARTHLSRFMLLEPLAMMEEERHLRALGVPNAFERTTIDEGALLITPFQRAVNRLKELARGTQRHGSCGIGVGETMSDYLQHGERVLFAGDLAHPDRLQAKLAFLREINIRKVHSLAATLPDTQQVTDEEELLRDGAWRDWLLTAYHDFAERAQIVPSSYLTDVMERPGTVVFEGAQGVLLDEWFGFHPYTTWGTTTLANADRLLEEVGYEGSVTRVGISRAYSTRHGAGPFVTGDAALSQALPDACNGLHPWQQGFRVGWLDLVLLRYAREVVGTLDYLALTCLDRLEVLPELKLCTRYQHDTFTVERIALSPQPRDLAYQERLTHNLARCQPLLERVASREALVERITQELALPVALISEGPTASDKYFR